MTETVREQLDTICRIIRETMEVEKIYLFGSYAYGTPDKDSDFDIYVVIPDGGVEPLDAMKKMYAALWERCDMPLDILAAYFSDFQWRKTEPTLVRKIVREGALLYEKSNQGVA